MKKMEKGEREIGEKWRGREGGEGIRNREVDEEDEREREKKKRDDKDEKEKEKKYEKMTAEARRREKNTKMRRLGSKEDGERMTRNGQESRKRENERP